MKFITQIWAKNRVPQYFLIGKRGYIFDNKIFACDIVKKYSKLKLLLTSSGVGAPEPSKLSPDPS